LSKLLFLGPAAAERLGEDRCSQRTAILRIPPFAPASVHRDKAFSGSLWMHYFVSSSFMSQFKIKIVGASR
jgi:hypothetical protein